ncbi:hypothetical protein [Baaleninema simplex]|uniref:hypothetical protein n=1 Tax=Baaleninema simplex TaxID=2862350 RepID=UPI0003453794|nr:hypothetical protein [Baaleninema simplex]
MSPRLRSDSTLSEVEASEVEASEVEASEVEASEVEASEVEASEVEASEVEALKFGFRMTDSSGILQVIWKFKCSIELRRKMKCTYFFKPFKKGFAIVLCVLMF